jgi:hypothetical protein
MKRIFLQCLAAPCSVHAAPVLDGPFGREVDDPVGPVDAGDETL